MENFGDVASGPEFSGISKPETGICSHPVPRPTSDHALPFPGVRVLPADFFQIPFDRLSHT